MMAGDRVSAKLGVAVKANAQNATADAVIATVYANTFSVEELRQIEAFYRQPVGQKFLEKSQAILQQSAQIGEDTGRKAAEALRTSLTQLLRQKGHKL